MSLRLGKTEHAKMIAVLDADHESVDEAADAALRVALEILESRAKFVVVGQLARTMERGAIDPSDPDAIKVCVDLYSTEGDANSAAETLALAHATHEEYRVWVLPIAHATTAEVLKQRKAALQAAEEKREEKRRAKFQDQIAAFAAKREQAIRDFIASEQAA